MKINSFNFLKNNSITYKNNLRKCSEIFKNLINNKENFFFNTLSEEYQKSLFLKRIVLKKRIYKNILIVGMGGSVLGTKMLSSFFGLDKNYYFLDNLKDIFNKNLGKEKKDTEINKGTDSGSLEKSILEKIK